MSAICGIYRLGGRPVNRTELEQMLATLAHRGPDGAGLWCAGPVGLGHRALWTTPESLKEKLPLQSQTGELVLTADSRIDNRKELVAALRLRSRTPMGITDAELILAAYARWGENCPERLIGDFAFALWDGNRRQLFCARDAMGVKGLYYHYSPERSFVFATEIKGLFNIEGVTRELNEARVADFLAFIFDDLENTFYRGIQRLPPAHSMTVGPRGLRIRRYWAFDPERELVLGSDAEYEEGFRELFIEAVRCRLRSAFPVGTTLSGGLDSSSIACIARDLLKADPSKKLHTFSAIFPSLPEKALRLIDERTYMEAVLATGEFTAHRVRADELSPLGDLDTVLWHLDEPQVPFNLYLHLGLYQSASSSDVRVVLDGFDGDTTVSHGYERLAELAVRFNWITLLREARALSSFSVNPSVTWWRIIQTHALQPMVPPFFGRLWQRIWFSSAMPPARESVINKSFAHRVKLDQRIRSVWKTHAFAFRSARETHRRSLSSSLIPFALEQADKAAAAFNLEARYPFLDRRLAEYCLSIPASQKLSGGWPRSLLRNSMRHVLPDKVRFRRSKANLAPNFHRGLINSRLSVAEWLNVEEHGAICEFVDATAFRRVYERHRRAPTDADGMLLFTVAALSKWIDGFGSNSRSKVK
jgi:asparagine synthase (glutamine-hydrolysing)